MAVADTWVTVGMLYGLPCNASHKQARYQTDALLAELVDRVACQTVGPRAMGGDFNYGPEELDQIARLQALGFREAQDLRAWRHGCSVEPTGRGSKRIDQLWLSPELQRGYLDTTVAFDHWLIMLRSVLRFPMLDFRCLFLLGPVLCNSLGRLSGLVRLT